jgi:hypothetical protein
MQLTAQKAQQVVRQNAALRAQLRAARQKIKALVTEVERSERIILDKTELTLLSIIADSGIEDGFTVDLIEPTGLTPVRLEYHLQRLFDGGYIEVLFIDPTLGDNFAITQQGRYALVNKRLA